jgi:hypothetical protein
VPSPENKNIVETQIRDWVLREVAYPDTKRGKCAKVIVRHLNLERKPNGDVIALPVKLEEGAEDEIEPLLAQIAEAAQQDATDANSGVQTYAIYAYYSNDSSYVPRKIFRVAADTEFERDLAPSEPPTEKGLVAQSMRHVEAVMRHATISTGMQIQSMQRENQRLAEMVERFSAQQLDLMVLLQDTMNDATKRRLAERREEANLAIKEEALSKVSALLPAIVNRISGKQVLPEEDPGIMLLSSLFESMTDEQQNQLMSMLSPAQKMSLAEVFRLYEEKKSKWLESKKKLALNKNQAPPPSQRPSAPSQRREIPVEVESPPDQSLRAQLTAAGDAPKDPVLQKIEEDGDRFMDRFRSFTEFLTPPKEPPK